MKPTTASCSAGTDLLPQKLINSNTLKGGKISLVAKNKGNKYKSLKCRIHQEPGWFYCRFLKNVKKTGRQVTCDNTKTMFQPAELL